MADVRGSGREEGGGTQQLGSGWGRGATRGWGGGSPARPEPLPAGCGPGQGSSLSGPASSSPRRGQSIRKAKGGLEGKVPPTQSPAPPGRLHPLHCRAGDGGQAGGPSPCPASPDRGGRRARARGSGENSESPAERPSRRSAAAAGSVGNYVIYEAPLRAASESARLSRDQRRLQSGGGGSASAPVGGGRPRGREPAQTSDGKACLLGPASHRQGSPPPIPPPRHPEVDPWALGRCSLLGPLWAKASDSRGESLPRADGLCF